jgi:hypothetical protein
MVFMMEGIAGIGVGRPRRGPGPDVVLCRASNWLSAEFKSVGG